MPGHCPFSAARLITVASELSIRPLSMRLQLSSFTMCSFPSLQEAKPKKRKLSPADENDSGIEVYYREEEDGDQEGEAAEEKSKVRSWKESCLQVGEANGRLSQ